jgi:putative peptide zinc metalloprotease protein
VTAKQITGAARVRLHDLHMRPDRSEWVIGRVDTGEFVAIPQIAVDALHALSEGLTIDKAHRRLQAEHGRDIDVEQFVAALMDLGFVAAIDDHPLAGPPIPEVTLRRLRAAHVRWVLTWPTALGLTTLTIAGAVALTQTPGAAPSYHDLLWSPHSSVVLAGNTAIAWTVILLHELAHLITARAADLPGRMSLSTRLQFLAAQTDVSGIWAQRQSVRVTVYLAGMAINVAVAAVACLVQAGTEPQSLAGRLSAATTTISLLCLLPQCLVFMRTDLYYLLQDLSGCRNLYADGSAYLRWWVLRTRNRLRSTPLDPSRSLPARERRAVRAYAMLLLAGTAACLGVALTVTLPIAASLLTTAGDGLLTGPSVTDCLDGLLTLAVIGGYWALWCRAWWRRHSKRLPAWHRIRRRHPAAPTPNHAQTGR